MVGHAPLIHLECLPLVALALLLLAGRRTRVADRLPGGLRPALLADDGVLRRDGEGRRGRRGAHLGPLPGAPPTTRPAFGRREPAMAIAVVLGVRRRGAGRRRRRRCRARRTPRENVARFGLRPLELVVPSPANPTFSASRPAFWESRRHGSNIQETSNYLGWMTIVLALMGRAVAAKATARRGARPCHRPRRRRSRRFPHVVPRHISSSAAPVVTDAVACSVGGRARVPRPLALDSGDDARARGARFAGARRARETRPATRTGSSPAGGCDGARRARRTRLGDRVAHNPSRRQLRPSRRPAGIPTPQRVADGRARRVPTCSVRGRLLVPSISGVSAATIARSSPSRTR